MQVYLILPAKKGGTVHGTDSGKKTGCGINLTKPENIGQFITGDLMTDLKEITCEKCKIVLAKRIIKENNKEMAKQLKDERKMRKNNVDDGLGPIQSRPTPPPAPARTAAVAPPPIPVAPTPSRSMAEPVYTEYKPPVRTKTVTAAPVQAAPAAPTAPAVDAVMNAKAPAAAKNDFLAQFAIPVPPAQPEPATPAKPAPAPKPVDDAIAQFIVPPVTAPKPEPVAPAPAPKPVDDAIAQFIVPPVTAPQPEPVAPAPAPKPVDDAISQFIVPPVTAPKPEPVAPAPAPKPVDDAISQFIVPPVTAAKPEPVAPAAPKSVDDEISQFIVPPVTAPKPEPVAPAAPKAEPVASAPIAPQKAAAPAPETEIGDLDSILNDLDNSFQKVAPKASRSISITAPASDIIAVTEQARPEEPKSSDNWDEVANSLFGNVPAQKQTYSTQFDEDTDEELPEELDEPEPTSEVLSDIDAILAGMESFRIPDAKPVASSKPAPLEVPEIFPEPMPEPESIYVAPAPQPEPKPEPVFVAPAPQPEPIPEPVFVAPAPQPEPIPEPVFVAPAPQPEPIPEPVYVAPAPQPEPKPEPVFVAPAPQPEPKPEPVYVAPAPQPEPKPEPVYVAPAPQPEPKPQPVFRSFETAPEPQSAPVPVVESIEDILASMQQMSLHNPTPAPVAAPKPAPVRPNPVFAGYSAQGQPVFQEFDEYGQPIPITQPVYSLPPVQQAPLQPGGLFQSAIANQKQTAKSIFDLESGAVTPPVIDSIDDILTLMGESTAAKKKQEAEAEVVPDFIEYKAPVKESAAAASPAIPEVQPPKMAMTKAEAKRQKKLDKINAEFEKQLKARGFDTTEGGRFK